MGLLEKIVKKTKTGLAVLAAGTMISGVAYAKEINNEGWSVPDDSKYSKLREDIREFSCNYKGKCVVIKVGIESYASLNEQGYSRYYKYSFEGKTFMYDTLEAGGGLRLKMEILIDQDGNGSLETKYVGRETDEKLDAMIPEWVLDKAEENQKTETD